MLKSMRIAKKLAQILLDQETKGHFIIKKITDKTLIDLIAIAK